MTAEERKQRAIERAMGAMAREGAWQRPQDEYAELPALPPAEDSGAQLAQELGADEEEA